MANTSTLTNKRILESQQQTLTEIVNQDKSHHAESINKYDDIIKSLEKSKADNDDKSNKNVEEGVDDLTNVSKEVASSVIKLKDAMVSKLMGVIHSIDKSKEDTAEEDPDKKTTLKDIILSIIGLKDAIVSKLVDVTSSIRGVLSGWYDRISEPIKPFLAPLIAIGATVLKIFKMIRAKMREKGILGTIKDFLKDSLFVIGAVIGGLLGTAFNYFIKRPMESIGLVINGLEKSLKMFGGLFKEGGVIGKIITWFNELRPIKAILDSTPVKKVTDIFKSISGWFQSIKTGEFGVSISKGITEIGKLFEGLKGVIGKITAPFSKVIQYIGDMSVVKGLLKGIKFGISKVLMPFFIIYDFIKGYTGSKEKDIGKKIIDGIRGVFRGFVQPIFELVETVGGWLGINTKGLTDKVMRVINPLIELLLMPFKNIMDFVSGFVATDGSFWKKTRGGIKNMFSGIKNTMLEFFQSIGRLFNIDDLLGTLRNVIMNSPLPDLAKTTLTRMLTPNAKTASTTTSSGTTDNKGNTSTSPGDVNWEQGSGGGTTATTPASPNVSSAGSGDVSVNNTSASQPSTTSYQPSAEAQMWFKEMSNTNKLLQKWLETNMNLSSGKGGQNQTAINSSNINNNTSNGVSQLPLHSIPTDVGDPAVLFAISTYGFGR